VSRSRHSSGPERTAALLAVLLVVQALAAVFFVADVSADFAQGGLDAHHVLEAGVSAALVVGVVFGGIVMRRTLEEARRSRAAAEVAQGAMGDLVAAYFKTWRLTPAEAEVALLALKGFDVAGIARLRGAAPGTVRAQLTRVYAKSGVSSRAELLSLFIEDLLGAPEERGVPRDKARAA